MNGPILASYILKAQQQSARDNGDFLVRVAEEHRAAKRVALSLASVAASFAAAAVVVQVLV